MDNGGNIYNYNIYNVAGKTGIIGSEELLMKYGKAAWSIDNQGRLLMQRLLINIYTTRAVGQINVVVSPRYLTGIYEQDLIGLRGYILIFDREGHFVPSINQNINDIASLLFQSGKKKNSADFSYNGEQYIISRTEFPEGDFEMFHILPLREIGIYTRTLPLMTSLAAAAAIIATILAAHIISSRITNGINLLIKGIRRFAEGDFNSPVEVKSLDEIGYLAVEFNRMADSINRLITDIYEAELKKRKAETNALRFEYSALESKINPHFIYNTLESVNSLAKLKGADDISRIICLLGDLLRDNISSTVEIIPLKKEIENISRYLQIQKLADGEKFDIHITVQENARQAMVPKFILQPLVENALYHGILVSIKHGDLFLHIKREGENLSITISDNGVGMNREKLFRLLDYSVEPKDETGVHTKVGVRTVDKRLKILYGEKYGLRIESEENTGTTVNLLLPFFTAE
jgi:sensor histidine kinase YesM